MKKLLLSIFIPLFLLIFCSCDQSIFVPNEITLTENTSNNADINVEPVSEKYISDEILVILEAHLLNKDFSVYTPKYFGTEFIDCTIYDLYAYYGLYIILKVNEVNVENIEDLIKQLNEREDVLRAERITNSDKAELTEYTPGKVVHLLNRYYPFSDEYTGFDYPRKYRLIYYYTTNYDDLVSQEKNLEWFNYYMSKNQYVTENGTHIKDPDEMALVSFIKYCDIPKDVFEARNNELKQFRKNNSDDFHYYTECGEIANADILYTFDNDIINEYYSYE